MRTRAERIAFIAYYPDEVNPETGARLWHYEPRPFGPVHKRSVNNGEYYVYFDDAAQRGWIVCGLNRSPLVDRRELNRMINFIDDRE